MHSVWRSQSTKSSLRDLPLVTVNCFCRIVFWSLHKYYHGTIEPCPKSLHEHGELAHYRLCVLVFLANETRQLGGLEWYACRVWLLPTFRWWGGIFETSEGLQPKRPENQEKQKTEKMPGKATFSFKTLMFCSYHFLRPSYNFFCFCPCFKSACENQTKCNCSCSQLQPLTQPQWPMQKHFK